MDRDEIFDAFARGLGGRANRRRLIAAGALAAIGLATPAPSLAGAKRRRRIRHCPDDRVCGKRCCAAGKWCGNPVRSICVGPDNPVSMQ